MLRLKLGELRLHRLDLAFNRLFGPRQFRSAQQTGGIVVNQVTLAALEPLILLRRA
jgi:hypothetical protein